MDTDFQVRVAGFEWLAEQVQALGDVLPRKLLEQGFEFQGQRIPLIGPPGIFKPKLLDLPISINTSPNSPYDDHWAKDGFLNYSYRGTDPNHRDNVGLRTIFESQRPIIYLFGLVPGKYLVTWPVYIIADNPTNLKFTVAVDDMAAVEFMAEHAPQISGDVVGRRAYVTATVRVRLHQRNFREKVIDAYRSQCAFCRLKHRELLDAAHIIPDTDPAGEPAISNGLALCKLHHSAYDSFILGVTPDYIIHVRKDILDEDDGPVLQHALKGLHQTKLYVPNALIHKPSKDSLAWRYEKFSRAG